MNLDDSEETESFVCTRSVIFLIFFWNPRRWPKAQPRHNEDPRNEAEEYEAPS